MSDKKLKLKPLRDGSAEVFNGDTKLGVVEAEDLLKQQLAHRQELSQVSLSAKTATLSVDREIFDKTSKIMTEDGLTFGKAFKKLLLSDGDLARRYRAAHSKPLPE